MGAEDSSYFEYDPVPSMVDILRLLSFDCEIAATIRVVEVIKFPWPWSREAQIPYASYWFYSWA